jgi:hypothetical protein
MVSPHPHEIKEKYICLATDRALGRYSVIPFRLNRFVKRKLHLEMEINICTYFIYTVMAKMTVYVKLSGHFVLLIVALFQKIERFCRRR